MGLQACAESRSDSATSCQNVADDVAVDVGEAEVAAGVAVGEALVVEAQKVQDRRLDVVDVDSVLDGIEAQLVSRAVRQTALDTAARQPHREGLRVMVAAQAAAERSVRLDHRRA